MRQYYKNSALLALDRLKYSYFPTPLYGVFGEGKLPIRSREFYRVALEDQTQENPVLKTWVKPESFNSKRHKESAIQPEPQTGALAKRTDLVLWHDIVTVSISAHRSNNFKPCSVTELLDLINCITERLIAIVYCQCFGT